MLSESNNCLKADVVVIGAGAAGLMAAITAGKNGKQVIVIDRSKKLCEKIRISGGGRCNFTNIGTSPENFISSNPHFCKSALSQYTAEDFIKLVEKHQIKFHEKKLGQLFCDESSEQIINMLLKEARQAEVKILNPVKVENILIQDTNDFICQTESAGSIQSSSLIIATGGLSIPQIGASNFGYKFAESIGLKCTSLYPALVPLVSKEALEKNLIGTSIDSRVGHHKTSFRENILFTHKGISGPAILQISSYIKDGDTIDIDLCPELKLQEVLLAIKNQENPIKHIKLEAKQRLKTILSKLALEPEKKLANKDKINRETILPSKLINYLEQNFDLSRPIAEYPREELVAIADHIKNFRLKIDYSEGYGKAEVTKGGIDTNELESKTMMSKKYPGLFFIGEVVDVTGWLGGYNFQWAWASGWVAGNNC